MLHLNGKPPLATSAQFEVVSPMAITNAPTTTEFENDSPPDGIDDTAAIFAKVKAESQKQTLEAQATAQAAAQKEWEKVLPDYTYTLQSLYDVLRDVAAKRGDGISKTDGYYRCLPSLISWNTPDTKLAEIRFQKQTNIDFSISLMDENGTKSLKIDATSGTLRVFRWDPENGIIVSIPSINFSENKKFSNGNGHDGIRDGIKIFISAQLASQTSTNKSVTKTLDSNQ